MPPTTLVPALFVPVAAELSVGESVVDDPESAAEPLPDDESALPPGDVPSGQILVELFGS